MAVEQFHIDKDALKTNLSIDLKMKVARFAVVAIAEDGNMSISFLGTAPELGAMINAAANQLDILAPGALEVAAGVQMLRELFEGSDE